MLELCRVAASAYGSPLRTALRAMGDTAAGGGVSERANACVYARAALFASCVSLACVGLRCCWGAIERGQLVYGDCAACLRPHVAEIFRRGVWVGGSIGVLVCGGRIVATTQG